MRKEGIPIRELPTKRAETPARTKNRWKEATTPTRYHIKRLTSAILITSSLLISGSENPHVDTHHITTHPNMENHQAASKNTSEDTEAKRAAALLRIQYMNEKRAEEVEHLNHIREALDELKKAA